MNKLIIILLTLNQCVSPPQDFELSLSNEELFFSPIFSNNAGGIEILYEDYITKEDQLRAKNLLRYKVTNNLSFKVMFIPNSNELFYISDELKADEDFHFGLSYSINDANGQKIPFTPSSFSLPKNEDVYIENFEKENLEYIQDSIKYESVYDRIRLKDFTFLEPYETRTFEVELNLPIVQGSNNPCLLGPSIHPLYLEEEYTFQLHYIQNKKQLEIELPKEVVNYLNKNQIKIIDLSLHSKPIKLKPRI